MMLSNSGGAFTDGLLIASGQKLPPGICINRSREFRRIELRAERKAQEMRLRRLLRKDNQRLCIPRSKFMLEELGIHVVDDRNIVVANHCSVEALLEEIENG